MYVAATYRRNEDESEEDLKRRHGEYYWLGRYLREAVECFGDKIWGSKIKSFWHGINQQMLLSDASKNIFLKK